MQVLPVFVMILYGISALLFWQVYQKRFHVLLALGLMVLTVQLHGLQLFFEVKENAVLNLSIFKVISVYAWGVALLSVFWFWRPSMALAGMMVCAMCALFVLLPMLFGGNKIFDKNLPVGMIWHILTSIASWTILSMSFLHAVLYLWLFQRLKQKQLKNIQDISLTGLERGMMLLSLLGFIFLSIALLTGWLFVEDLFAQHLLHKTVLTLMAWVLLLGLIVGFYVFQWRGMTVVYGLLAMFAFLFMGYVISNIIVQFLIN